MGSRKAHCDAYGGSTRWLQVNGLANQLLDLFGQMNRARFGPGMFEGLHQTQRWRTAMVSLSGPALSRARCSESHRMTTESERNCALEMIP